MSGDDGESDSVASMAVTATLDFELTRDDDSRPIVALPDTGDSDDESQKPAANSPLPLTPIELTDLNKEQCMPYIVRAVQFVHHATFNTSDPSAMPPYLMELINMMDQVWSQERCFGC